MDLNVSYGITRKLPGVALQDARARIIEALKEEGFGVLTEIDVQATLKKKIDVDIEPYVILGACNPTLAHRGIMAEPGLGLLLPCNVVVAKDAQGAVISAASPQAMFGIIRDDSGRLAGIAEEAETKLRRAIERA